MAWIGWAERVEDSRPERTAPHQHPEPGEIRHVDRPMRLPLLRMVRGAPRAAARTGRPAADFEAQLLAALRRAPARNELAAPAVLASPRQIPAHPRCHGAAVEPRNPRARIEILDRTSALAAAPADAAQHLPHRRPARIPRVAHPADEPACNPAVALAQIAEIPLHGHDAAVRQEALFAVHDQRGDILEPAIREAVEGRLEALDVVLAHCTNIGPGAVRLLSQRPPGADRRRRAGAPSRYGQGCRLSHSQDEPGACARPSLTLGPRPLRAPGFRHGRARNHAIAEVRCAPRETPPARPNQ